MDTRATRDRSSTTSSKIFVGPASRTIVSWFFDGGPDIDFADLSEANETGEVVNIEFDTSPSGVSALRAENNFLGLGRMNKFILLSAFVVVEVFAASRLNLCLALGRESKLSLLSSFVVLRRSLSNPSAPLRALITRSQRKTYSPTTRPERPSRRDQRGPVATQALKSQTRLSYPQRQKLLDAYASGMPVKQIAERFGVHRATIARIASGGGVTMRKRPSSAAE
ncbi:helix-turn-helix domain-containing protein [Propionimicrobium sp. PCR01-08-3]|uniref:helix-turn-helix domain-containing protein n=1 Tax=Propionimicrobium sp. PCR01-08-3 TaxID=3052086 RepID=UPI00255D0E61|nr:helix-turn-helix domain-containing protein [Propionimicrobium sp. PCR01-08-3]WIY83734.1 helix-turn-helix domain-containing protein [Propionimicrobium sp. PCR01-08-3]